jgi:hypothetical protein
MKIKRKDKYKYLNIQQLIIDISLLILLPQAGSLRTRWGKLIIRAREHYYFTRARGTGGGGGPERELGLLDFTRITRLY